MRRSCLSQSILRTTSERFARGRLRRVMPLLEDEGLSVDRLCDLGHRASWRARRLIIMRWRFYASPPRWMLPVRSASISSNCARRPLRSRCVRWPRVCKAFMPRDYAPEYDLLRRLYEALCGDEDMPPRTLHGCLVSRSERHALILREVSGIAEGSKPRSGSSVIWDQRWRVSLEAGAKDFSSLGRSAARRMRMWINSHLICAAVSRRAARAALPALWRGAKLAAIPALAPEKGVATAELLTAWPPAKF